MDCQPGKRENACEFTDYQSKKQGQCDTFDGGQSDAVEIYAGVGEGKKGHDDIVDQGTKVVVEGL